VHPTPLTVTLINRCCARELGSGSSTAGNALGAHSATWSIVTNRALQHWQCCNLLIRQASQCGVEGVCDTSADNTKARGHDAVGNKDAWFVVGGGAAGSTLQAGFLAGFLGEEAWGALGGTCRGGVRGDARDYVRSDVRGASIKVLLQV
jgi:hypothetical protein